MDQSGVWMVDLCLVFEWWSENRTERACLWSNVQYSNGLPSHVTLLFEYWTPILSGVQYSDGYCTRHWFLWIQKGYGGLSVLKYILYWCRLFHINLQSWAWIFYFKFKNSKVTRLAPVQQTYQLLCDIQTSTLANANTIYYIILWINFVLFYLAVNI